MHPPLPDPQKPPPHAIVVGYGPVGRMTAEGLRKAGHTVTILDTNPLTIRRQTALGKTAILGDARKRGALEAAGIHHAHTLVLTMPDAGQALEACKTAHALKPDVFIIARANFVSEGMQALQHGADHVIVEEIVTASAMQKVAMEHAPDPPPPPPEAPPEVLQEEA